VAELRPALDTVSQTSLFHSSGIWPVAIHDSTTVEGMEPDRNLVLLAKGRPFGFRLAAIAERRTAPQP
jgi:hypothetical protein